MALITCKNCGKPLSDRAEQCPHCGSSTGVINSPTLVNTYKRKIDPVYLGLLLIFGSSFLEIIINYSLRMSYFSQSVLSLVSIIFTLVRLGGYIYILKKGNIKNAAGKIGAIICSLISIFYMIVDISIINGSYFGSYVLWVILNSILFVSISLLIFNLNINKSIAIMGGISYIPIIITNIMWLFAPSEYDLTPDSTFVMTGVSLEGIRILLKLTVSIMVSVKLMKLRKSNNVQFGLAA